MHTEYLIRNQSLRRKVLAIYRPDRKLAGTIGDGRALQMTPGPCRGRQSIKMTAGPYRQIPFPIRLQGPAVNPQDCRLYERRTPCPAVRTHPARDARDYSPPGPCLPPGTVGNTDCRYERHCWVVLGSPFEALGCSGVSWNLEWSDF